MRWPYLIFILVILIGLGVSSYLLWLNFPTEQIEFEKFKANISQDLPPHSAQFYNNMRYAELPITYSLAQSCSAKKQRDFNEGVERLETETILEFEQTTQDADIEVTCSNIAPEPEQEGHFVAGEGGPTLIVNTTRYAIILKGQVALYRPERCEEAQIATHEILHALGFDHNNNENSIMYPYTYCDQIIDEHIKEEIQRVYSQPTLPDILIEKVEATRSGRYLNFEITVANYGLKNNLGSVLKISSNSEPIDEFTIEPIEIGAKRKLTVSNLRIPKKAGDILFEAHTTEQEIEKENNFATITPLLSPTPFP